MQTAGTKTMPKHSDGAPPKQSVKIDADVVQMARTIVANRGGGMDKLVSDTCRPIFRKLIERMIEAGEMLPEPKG